ncbi:MAG: hypothetical protein KKE23_03425 [Nanoarchaeota archaeon]|nr:hypothetical protein [Nanoarchaeota archaeon]
MAFKYRFILVIVGLLIVLTGAYPLIANLSFVQGINGLPVAGTTIYQSIIILLGIISIGYGLQGQAKKQAVHQK